MEWRRCSWCVAARLESCSCMLTAGHTGDKSNHIATIHLTQMLYIWPLFAFFSAPLLIPSVLPIVEAPLRLLVRRDTAHNVTTTSNDGILIQVVKRGYYIPYILGTILASLAIVRYNTIIHPFTLADNRHYMFYVFRYTILRSPALRYSLVAAYTVTRWLVWHTLAGHTSTRVARSAASAAQVPDKSTKITSTVPGFGRDSNSMSTSSQSTPTSTALFWLLATTLSLITAPLVEPRYFILPWVFWRLLVPAWTPAAGGRGGSVAGLGWVQQIDPRLVLETVWFLAINVGTMYMFLFRPFYWRSADGEVLDGGNVQRFMW